MRTFEFSDAKSHKFWSIDVSGTSFTVTYGKIGTVGQAQTKSFPTAEKAQAEADKLIREKTGKGYVEKIATPKDDNRDALEKAIQAHPEDIAAHSALADLLLERGDPLGEFMRVQLALEDPNLNAAERRKLKTFETKLLKEHEKEWVGDWINHYPELAGPEGRSQIDHTDGKKYRFTRGLLTTANFGVLSVKAASLFVSDSRTRFIRDLFIGDYAHEDDEGEWNDDAPGECAARIATWPHLKNIRRLQFGFASDEVYRDEDGRCWFQTHMPQDGIGNLVKAAKNLEELYVFAHHRADETGKIAKAELPRLRILQLYHGWSFPLEQIAKNASFSNLTHLLCHPHAHEHGDEAYITLRDLKAICRSPHLKKLHHLRLRLADFGDEGAKEIATSGILKQLKVLDLRHGAMTDAGVELLVNSPDFKKLEFVDLYHNALTKEGEKLLKKTGVKHDARRQYVVDEDDEYGGYLSEGDYE